MSDFDTLLALERGALARWSQGDPSGFLEISLPEVSYFDPFQARRLESRAELAALYESLRGKVAISDWRIDSPRVQINGDTAILTFHFVSNEAAAPRWFTTEVYVRTPQGWRIAHTHWALPASAA
jgi:hypothetical protein